MLRRIDWYIVTDISKQRTAFFFRDKQYYSRMLIRPIRSFEVLLAVCQSTRHDIARDLILQQHHCE